MFFQLRKDWLQLTVHKFKSHGFPLSANKGKCIGKISGLYDITNNIIIDYVLNTDFNEHANLINQLEEYPRKDDIIIADAECFSENIFIEIVTRGIDCILRLK